MNDWREEARAAGLGDLVDQADRMTEDLARVMYDLMRRYPGRVIQYTFDTRRENTLGYDFPEDMTISVEMADV